MLTLAVSKNEKLENSDIPHKRGHDTRHAIPSAFIMQHSLLFLLFGGPVGIFVSMTLNFTKYAAKGTVPFLSTIATRRCPQKSGQALF
jgi:hypothetical protein